jgi:phosphoenolpyruvate carboxykinase (GTP)
MAMLPFCGYNMGDYFDHWLKMVKKTPNPPKIFNVNWFRTSEKGEFLWPGYGENLRVLNWILSRCNGEVGAVETPIGYLPEVDDIDISGLEGVSRDMVKTLLNVDRESWKGEVKDLADFLGKFDRLPGTIKEEYDCLIKRFEF